MAAAPDSLIEILSCQVCFEEFEEYGDHVPRILPCSHTFCHTCIGRMIEGIRIECPECRMKHEAKKEEKTFPQNKYILIQIKKTQKLHVDHSQPEKCKEHGKELNIFCKELGCQRVICLSCLSQSHKKHEVVEIEERKKEMMAILQKNIKAVTDNLQRKKQNITEAKQDAKKKIEKNIKDLKMKKEQYDKMIRESEAQMKQIEIKTNQDLNAMNETLNLLHDIDKSTEAREIETYRTIDNKLDTVSGIIQNVNKHLTGRRTYEYHIYATNIETQTTKREISVDIKEEMHVAVESLDSKRTKMYAEQKKNPARRRGLQIKLTEIKTDFSSLSHLTVLSGGTVAAYGRGKLTCYNLVTGRTISSTKMTISPVGMGEVKFRRKSSLVLSIFRRLEFRDPRNLETIIYTHSVAPHEPFKLCVAPPSTLFFVDYQSGRPSNIYSLDCSRKTPTLCQSIGPYDHNIYSMSYVKYLNENLLVIAVDKGMQTFQLDTGVVKWWKKDIQLPGQNENCEPYCLAANRKGRLFVTDLSNKCIQMFSVSDGQYLGYFIKEGKRGLGVLGKICFREATSQLVVSHRKDEKILIAVFNVE